MDETDKYYRKISRPGPGTDALSALPEEKRKRMAEKRQRYMEVTKIIEKCVVRSLDNDVANIYDLLHYRTMARELIGRLWQAAKMDEDRAIIRRGELPAKIEARASEIKAMWVGRGLDAKLVEKVLGVAREKFVQLLKQEPNMFVSSDESTARPSGTLLPTRRGDRAGKPE